MGNARFGHWFYISFCLLILTKTQGFIEGGAPVGITTLGQDAVSKGAVCLDGSPPAYNFDKGFGDGVDNWLIFLQGGGWCRNATDCGRRALTDLGSSTKMQRVQNFTGILDNNSSMNPDFYNWNRVFIRYCDGSSFTGDVEEVDPATKLHYRGARIFKAVLDELFAKGLKNAKNAFLCGCSAGGLAVMANCDHFRALLPPTTKVKCLSDGGYFFHSDKFPGGHGLEPLYEDVIKLHCFFPQTLAREVKTPLFILNSLFDEWQVQFVIKPPPAALCPSFLFCANGSEPCSPAQIQLFEDFRKGILESLEGIENSKSRGLYLNSCYIHCQATNKDIWNNAIFTTLNNRTIAKAVGDWYLDRSPFQVIDFNVHRPQKCMTK